MKYKEIIYMVLDEVKLISDDSTFTEEHVRFLVDKWRTALLKKLYSETKKDVPSSNYQTICLTLEESDAIDGEPCTGGSYLRSVEEIPDTLDMGSAQVYPTDYFQGEFVYVSKEKMRYVGFNKWLKNIIYVALGADNHLYFMSSNPQHMYLEQVSFTAVFEDSEAADELSCDGDSGSCDPMESTVPIEDALVPQLIELVVKELLGAAYRGADTINNANDDLSGIANYIRQNMKSGMQRQLEGDQWT